jgi:hypothetical protein
VRAEYHLLRACVRRRALCERARVSLLLLLQRHTRVLSVAGARERRARGRCVGEYARSDFRHALLRVCLSCVHFVQRTLTVLSRMRVRAIVCVYVRVRARVRFPGAHAATFLRRALVRVRLPRPRMRAHHFVACILGRTKKLVDGLVVRRT